MPKTPAHAAALEYATVFGWYVFPIEPPRAGDEESGKKPATWLVPNGKDDATRDPSQIDRWYATSPELGVGISLEPSNLVVLDVDVGQGKHGRDSLAALEKEIALPLTLTATTGGGGLHAFYQRDPNVSVAQRIGFREGLDLIVKGYVVAAPSPHYTGGAYRWSQVVQPVPIPAALAWVANAPRKRPADSKANLGIDEAIPEGGRNDAMFRLGASLRASGIGDDALKSALHFENQRRFSPPLPDHEVLHIAESIMRRVTPTRDAALGAVVEEIARTMLPVPGVTAQWVRDVALEDIAPVKFYQTGFPQLDAMLGDGVCTQQVCGIIGPPSCGKSAFVGSIAEFLSTQIPVLHVSTELPKRELMVRYAAVKMGFPWRDGIKGKIPRDQMTEATKALNIKLIGCDDLSRTDPLLSIAKEADALCVLTGKRPAIIIDYVQLMARGSGSEVRSKVGDLTMQIRIMSQVLDCPILAVFSTRRDFYNTKVVETMRVADDPTAYLGAAKESGDIEFDCATILYLDVDKLHEGQPKPARIVVARCRVGDIGFAGARAKLDTGVWYADPSATVEMTADDRSAKKNVDRIDKDCQRILELLEKMPARPWAEVRNATGFGRDRADAAKALLFEQCKIESVRQDFFDALERKQTRSIIQITPGNIPSAVNAGKE